MRMNYVGWILGILGQGLILLAFLLILPDEIFGLESIKWLDFGVLSIVYWLWISNFTLSPLNLRDPSQKGIGGLGIKWIGSIFYTLFALGFAIACMFYAVEGTVLAFKWQILAQGVILFFLFVMLFNSAVSMDKVEEVYHAEKEKKEGKKNVRNSLQNLAFMMESRRAPGAATARVKNLNEEARFLTPSDSDAAVEIENRIADCCEAIMLALTDVEINSRRIEELSEQLEMNFRMRKQTN